LIPLLRSGSLNREDELTVRSALAEAWLLQDDLQQATSALGRPPDTLQERISDAQLSKLWRLHGRIAHARGEQSRAIALHSRALKHAELAHESRAIGLAHYELALCYKQVGDSGIVREHLTEAASALHAAGDRRHLALVHSLSAVLLAQSGRVDEATAGLRQGERLAMAIPADDVLAGIVHNQANVALMRHRHDQALTLAERSVALHESLGSGHGLAVALATLGQIYVQLGDLERAEQILTRTLEVRSPIQFHETTGAVFDTLAQINLMRGSYERAGDYLRQASDAYGAYGTQTMRWYEWSLKVLGVKLAIRRRAYDEAVAMANALAQAPDVPPADAIQADLAACEALVAAGRIDEAQHRLETCESRLDPKTTPANWGEFLRIRGLIREQAGRPQLAHHDFAQSANIFELLGERYQAALSQLALGRIAAAGGSRSAAERNLDSATTVFKMLGAERDLDEAGAARELLSRTSGTPQPIFAPDAEEGIVRRLVDAALFPELLSRETATAIIEATDADAVVIYVESPTDLRIVASAGCDSSVANTLARAAHQGSREYGDGGLLVEALGKEHDGPRRCVIAAPERLGDSEMRRLRMFAHIARQGFELCGLRDRPGQAVEITNERPLEPLIPGFICASAAMTRLSEQIQRLQGHNLTVLITGESGTGKDLVARAIHGGSPRRASMFLPFKLHDDHTRARGQSAVRSSSRQFHGSRQRSTGAHSIRNRRHTAPRRNRRPSARYPTEAAAIPRTRRDHAGRRDASAGCGRARARRDQCRPRATRHRRTIPRRSLLPSQCDPGARTAVARTARGDSAPEHVLPARRLRAAGQVRRPPQFADARFVRAVLVAWQRTAATERDSACGGDEPSWRYRRARTSVGRSHGTLPKCDPGTDVGSDPRPPTR
jgi:tetratricopeptide (TPR) repeat protein